MPKLIDLTGKRFGRLEVIEKAKKTKSGHTKWKCKCDCGNITIVSVDKLKSGHTKSCGCLQKEITQKCNSTHGKSRSKLYGVWRGMINRTTNENVWNYERYGGRGIGVCKEWRGDFQKFYVWSMQNGYKTGLSIDRIDNAKGYEPQNCRWTNCKEQSKNTRRNKYIKYNGKVMTESEWADEKHIKRETLCKRIKSGWSIEKALETPVGGKEKSNE